MKILIKKIFRRVFNHTYKLFVGMSYSDYMAARTNRSFDSMSSILLWMMNSIKKEYPDFGIQGKDVAEFGSGKFLAHAIGFKVLGASSVISFDLHRQFNQKVALEAYMQQVMAKKIYSDFVLPDEYMKVMDSIKSTKLDLELLKQHGINYYAPYDLMEYTSRKFYLITSYTVLEHVPPRDIYALLTKSVDTLISGGYFCHYIDLEDHLDPVSAPFDFLAEDNWSDRNCFSRGNRLRLADWDNLFNQIDGIDFEFVSILRRDASLLPIDIIKMSDSEIKNITTSGILVVGKKH